MTIKKPLAGIIDLSINNILSIRRALEHIGFKTITINEQRNVEKFDLIVLPGVGSYYEAMKKLKNTKLILSIEQALNKNKNFLGICLGMQMAVIEYARNVAGIEDAGSSELGDYQNPVIGLMTEWQTDEGETKRDSKSDLGGTMRLGSYPCTLQKGTKAYDIYGSENITERHRHRYEFNNTYKQKLEESGLVFSGTSPDGTLCEIVEIPEHAWFVAGQFHPEFKSSPRKPHPLFVKAAKAQANNVKKFEAA